MIQKIISTVCLSILLAGVGVPAYTQQFTWEIVTNLNDTRDLYIQNDSLFLATTGGFVIHPAQGSETRIFTTENGATDHYYISLARTEKNLAILGTLNGIIAFYHPREGLLYEDLSLKGNEIISIHAVSDTLWIASKKLIAVFLFDHERKRFQFRDFFTNFGRDFTSFNQIFYHEGKIWAACDNGLLFAPGNFLRYNLKSADNWQVLTVSNGLPGNFIYSLGHKEDTLYVGSSVGFSKYYSQQFHNSGNLSVRHILTHLDNLYIDDSRVIYKMVNSQFTPVYSSPVNTMNDFGLDNQGRIWVGYHEKGLENIQTGKRLRFNGPIENILGKMTLNSRGELWVTTGIYLDQRAKGLSVRLPDGNWKNYRHIDGWLTTSSTQAVVEDTDGNMWIGSWNGGLYIVDPQLNFYHFNNYRSPGRVWIFSPTEDDTVSYGPPDSVRHFLSYTYNYPDLLVVSDFLVDEERNCIWVATPYVQGDLPITCYQGTAFGPQAFDSISWEKVDIPDQIQIESSRVSVLTRDVFNNIWIGSDRNGVYAIQFQNSGTTNWLRLTENNNLKNNSCFALAGDQDGYVWIGTTVGLNAYLNGTVLDFREDYQPIGLGINDIFVDSENNKWFATDRGLSLLLSRGAPWDPNSWIHFVPRNSDLAGKNIYYTNLPSENIRSVLVDNLTGDVYCSTLSGLAILRSNPFTTPLEKLEQAVAGPNPLKISEGKDNSVYFRNLTANSEIKILTATGRLVRILNLNSPDFLGSFARWDCRNEEGRLVSSGVYLFMITDEAGNSRTGKLLLIRE